MSCPLPAVVTVTAGAVEVRYPNLKGIMAARSKPIEVLTTSDLDLDPKEFGFAGARAGGAHGRALERPARRAT